MSKKGVIIACSPAVVVVGMTMVLTLTLLGGSGQSAVAAAPPCGGLNVRPGLASPEGLTSGTSLTATQARNAKTIIGAGRRAHVPVRGQVIAIMVALQETRLLNLASLANPGSLRYPHDGVAIGDHDSVGIMQQRDAWGSLRDRMTVPISATMFYTGGRGGQSGLLDISGWQRMDPGVAAQAVQVSAYPFAYDNWTKTAERVVAKLRGIPIRRIGVPGGHCGSNGLGGRSNSAVVRAAATELGMPYVWGGGGINGPSGTGRDGRGPGFDCSGLVQYAVYKATHDQLILPRVSAVQATQGHAVRPRFSSMRPGDLVAFSIHGGGIDHIGIYAGHHKMIHAPHTGENVQYTDLTDPYWQALQPWTVRRLSR